MKVLFHKIGILPLIIKSSQYGFRREHSTELAALELIDDVTSIMDKGKIPIVIIPYFSKAFDSLNHKILLTKLSSYGVNPLALKLLLKSYLTTKNY